MFFRSFFGSNREANLVLTIGSSQVNAAVFRMAGEKPEILAVSRSEIVLSANLDFERFVISTRNAIENVLGKIRNSAPRPRKVICILASPWYVAQTRVTNYQAPQPFTVNAELIQSIVSREAQSFEAEQRRGHSVILGAENKIIEVIEMKTLLNGYETNKPLGKKVENLSISIFVSLTSQKIIQSFSEIIHKVFHHSGSDVAFQTLPLAAFSAVKKYFSGHHNFLLVEVGGEITDVLLSHRGVIEEVTSFPLGENFLYRSIAELFATLPKEAVSLSRSYSEGVLSLQESENLAKVVEHVKSEWLKSFQKVLELSSLEYLLPSKCFILASLTSGGFFKKFIADQSIASFTSDNKPFKAELLDNQLLKEYYLSTSTIGVPDAFQIIPVLFAAGLN